MTNATNNRCSQLMRQLQEIDFGIVETALYLDAYPEHRQALEYYGQLIEERRRITEQYETQCGPLTVYGNQAQNTWSWVKTPWPWEIEAN